MRTELRPLTIMVVTLVAVSAIRAAGTDDPQSSGAQHARTVTFTRDVAPIFFKRCADCHRPGEAAPMSLLTYQEARPWARSIRDKVVRREMPPWHADPRTGSFANDRRLTDDEIDTIKSWVDGRAPAGDPKDLPPPPPFVDGWNIGTPDLILRMPEAFTLQPSGPDEYQFFEVDPGFTEDKYVQMVETRPGNRRIVHHINAFIVPPSGATAGRPLTRDESERLRVQAGAHSIFQRQGLVTRLKPGTPVHDDGCRLESGGGGDRADGSGQRIVRTWLGGYAPGAHALRWAPGTVRRIPAGSKIVLNVHYSRTTGAIETDRSMVGLVFATEPPRREVLTRWIANHYFQIPPGAADHAVTACWSADDDIHLISVAPHMHYRGKAMEISVSPPGGREELLISVPAYDFSWQTMYAFASPVAIPKGTRFLIRSRFDNSVRNRSNPDPTQAVRWGDPTSDEMMLAIVEYTVDRQATSAIAAGVRAAATSAVNKAGAR
jgi:hypothetical protein